MTEQEEEEEDEKGEEGEEMKKGGDRRGMFEYDGESCCAMRGCCIAASRAKRSSTALHGRSNILLAVTEIYRRLARNFRLARWWIRLTARRGHPQLPCRSIDLPRTRILDRAHPDIQIEDAGRALHFSHSHRYTFFVNSSRADSKVTEIIG